MSKSHQIKLESTENLTREVSNIVTKITGIQLGDKQAHMVTSRIKKRLDYLGIKSEFEYLKYLKKNKEHETSALVSLLTTHHTYFFREFSHFEYLKSTALPELVKLKRSTGNKKIKVWSAACSHGQEVYSLAIFIDQVLKQIAPDFTYEVIGSDVDPESIDQAKKGVYLKKDIHEIPLNLISGNFLKGSGDIENFVKVKDVIKSKCSFEVVNLLNIPSGHFKEKFDIIFCRNVFIYFTQQQIKQTTEKLLQMLSQDGFLFIGISESLHGLDLSVSFVGPSIYRHLQNENDPNIKIASKNVFLQSAKSILAVPETPVSVVSVTPIRVLCVDDSSSILSLLKKILTTEHGFNVIDTARDGIEAAEKIKKQQFDIITLDMHMPNQSGLEFLKANPIHPPVVMISSVSRDDAHIAMSCLEFGATDYIEKPALSDFNERSEEIRTKLKYSFFNSKTNKESYNFVKSISKEKTSILFPESKLRIYLTSIPEYRKLATSLREMSGVQPPTVILVESAGLGLLALHENLVAACPLCNITLATEFELAKLDINSVVMIEAAKFFEKSLSRLKFRRIAIAVYGFVSLKTISYLRQVQGAQILANDLGDVNSKNPLNQIATDIVPHTSFYYMTSEFLARD